jgi:dual specificity MAP kinase phosphatase
MIDTPSHVMFPWLHGISDDGQKGRDMAAFFGRQAPFEPPAYRGLTLLFCPPHLSEPPRTAPAIPEAIIPVVLPSRERSETMSTSADSQASTFTDSSSLTIATPRTPSQTASADSHVRWLSGSILESDETPFADDGDVLSPRSADVQMHPLESKRESPMTKAEGLATEQPPLTSEPLQTQPTDEGSTTSSNASYVESEEEPRPSCILLNSLHVTDIFELPEPIAANSVNEHGVHYNFGARTPSPISNSVPVTPARFRQPRLPPQINLRNLNIQQIKYTSISDIILYAKGGVGSGVLDVAESLAIAQEEVYISRMEEWYSKFARGQGEGLSEPLRYGVWVLVGKYIWF